MSYSLEDFCHDVRGLLLAGDTREARDAIRVKLNDLLVDAEFCAVHLGEDSAKGVNQIYQDAETGFCVLTYNMTNPRISPPHDHGNSWAVYGQVEGFTDMTIWSAATPTDIEPVKTFRLDAGQAGLFDVGDIHSIDYGAGAKFVRITGVDMAQETRRVYNPEEGTVKEIEAVGAQPG